MLFKCLNNIPTANFLDLLISILLDEVLDMHEAASNPDKYLISFFYFDVYLSLSERVHAFRLPQEEYLHPLSLWILVDEISKCSIDFVLLLWNI